MPEENLELVRSALEAGARRSKPDFETINKLYHSDHVFVPVDVETTEVKGGAGYKTWLEENNEIMPWTMEFEDASEIDDQTVLAETTMQFHGEASDIDFEQRMWLVVTLADGRITRTEAYLDRSEALESAQSQK